MAPLEPKAIIVIALAIVFFALVGVYYFFKSKKRTESQTKIPKPVAVIANSVIILVAVAFFSTLALFSYFLFIVEESAPMLTLIPGLILLGLIGWLEHHKKIPRLAAWALSLLIIIGTFFGY